MNRSDIVQRMTSARQQQRGFARLDMLHALGALTLLVLLAGVPAMRDDTEEKLVTSQAHVSRSLSLAREMARQSGRPFALAFDIELDRLAVVGPDGNVALNTKDGEPLVAQLDADLLSVRFGDSNDTLLVAASGWPLTGGVLHFASGSRVLELRLDEATGWINAVLPDP